MKQIPISALMACLNSRRFARNVLLSALVWLVLPVSILAYANTPSEFDYSALERIPVQEGGRKKPFSTLATETMQALSGRAGWRGSGKDAGLEMSAVAALTDLWLRPDAWPDRNIILVNLKPLKERLGLPVDRKHFSYHELAGNAPLRSLLDEVRRLRATDRNAKLNRLQQEAVAIGSRIAAFEDIVSGRIFSFVPHPGDNSAKWIPLAQASEFYPGDNGSAIERLFDALKSTYSDGNVAAFSEATHRLRDELPALDPAHYPSAHLIELEHFYYSFHPFRWAWVLYAMAGIVLLVSSGWASRIGYSMGWTLALGGFAMQVFGFVCRILIAGRPPVTNMYESVIWVACGCIFFALVFEAIYRTRYFLLGAIPVAVVSLILADSQPTILSSAINPLVPVLRDNFWLTTHVLTITLSYAAFALALGVAHIVLGKAIIGSKPSQALYNYIYRTLQVGVFLLGTGTILGGVWANYSWGRFWDWDPKETWALIAFLCYLIILHGRIAGVWGGFGLAVGSVLAFLAVVMAWYGVNFVLGTGLHSYGFGTGGYPVVFGIVLAEFAFVALALIRHRAMLCNTSI